MRKSAVHIIRAVLLLFTLFTSSHGRYDDSYAFVDVRNVRNGQTKQFCVNFEQWRNKSARLATKPEYATALKLFWWSNRTNEIDICRDESRELRHGLVPLLYRMHRNQTGKCFWEKGEQYTAKQQLQFQLDRLEQQGAAAGIFLIHRGEKYYSFRDYLFNVFYDAYVNHSAIPLFFTYKKTFFEEMMKLSSGQSADDLEFRFHRPPSPVFDWAVVVIWILALLSITIGGIWAAKTKIYLQTVEERHKNEQGKSGGISGDDRAVNSSQETDFAHPVSYESTVQQPTHDEEGPKKRREQPEPASHHMGCLSLSIMIFFIVAILLFGYYFRFIMVYVFTVLYVTGGTCAVSSCLSALAGLAPCGRCTVCLSLNDLFMFLCRRHFSKCDCCHRRPLIIDILIFLLSAAFVLFWFCFRSHPYAFVLLNLINVCLSIHVIKGLRFANLKYLVILLTVMLVYDLFMVFLTPYLTRDGCSIMVQVATGAGCGQPSKDSFQIAPIESIQSEMLPVLFHVPRLSEPTLECIDLTVQLQFPPIFLGLGDVIMPGFLVAYCFGVDMSRRNMRLYIYGPLTVLAYGIGLVATFVALFLMQTAQPALIYLIPFTLIPVILLALCRQEFLLLWKGVEPTGLPDEAISQSATNSSEHLEGAIGGVQ